MGLKVSLVVLFVIPLYFSLSIYGQVVSPGTCPNIPTVRPFNVGHVSILFIIFFYYLLCFTYFEKKKQREFSYNCRLCTTCWFFFISKTSFEEFVFFIKRALTALLSDLNIISKNLYICIS